MFLYLSACSEAVSAVLVREDRGLKGQYTMLAAPYKIRKRDIRQQRKLVLALVHAARKLRPYFQAHSIVVMTDQPLRQILTKPEISGRMTKWAVELAEHDIAPIDLVVVNLYPFAETVAAGGSFDEIIEKIDVGGPTMVRGAAKNFASVAVVVDPEGYPIAAEAAEEGGFTLVERQELATIAFTRTAEYDEVISDWLLGPVAEDDVAAEPGVEADAEEIPSVPDER